ncbi:hypothetical protein ABK040_001315 [Willaertia magna]
MNILKDTRAKYIYERVEESFPSLKPLSIQELFEKNSEIIEKFVSGDKIIHKLLFEYRNEKNVKQEPELTINFDNAPSKAHKVLYIIRKDNNAISTKEALIPDSIVCGILDGNTMEYLHTIIDQVYIPLLSTQENWGKTSNEQSKELIHTTKRLSEKLNEVLSSKGPTVSLAKPAPEKQIPNTPNAIMEVKDKESIVSHYEGIVQSWINEIQRVIDDNMIFETDPGPNSEIEHWKNRFMKLNSIMEQLKKDEYKVVNSVLSAAYSPVYTLWRETDIKLTDAVNEAKDNVRYLSTLEKYIEPLYSSPPSHIIEIIPGLMKNISMMYSIAKYYSSKEKMEKLLVKISLQIIQNCKYTIENGGRLWDQDTDELLSNLKLCISLKEEYERCFFLEKAKLQQQKGREFDFDELKIFGKLRLFCRRIETLIELFLTIDQFNALKKHNIEGMDELISQFFTFVDELKRKSSNLLDYQRNAFDNEYMVFNKKIIHLEQYLQVFINTWFENISSSEQALDLLKKFKSILKRDTLQTELENKYTVIFHNYGFQLENIQKLYEKFKVKPPLVRNAPPVAGKVIWCRQLMRRIEEPMQKFKQIPTIMQSKESKKIIKTFNKVLLGLLRFEDSWLDAWRKYAEKAKDGLQASLIIKIDDRLYVNFDIEIIQLIRESKWLMRLGVEIPESAKNVLLQEHKFKAYFNELTFVLKERSRIISNVKNDLLPLLEPHLDELEKKLEPGLSMLTWTSMNIPVYLKKIHKILEKLEDVTTKINDIVEGRIEKNIKEIGSTLLVHFQENSTIEQLAEIQEKRSREISEQINIKSIDVERAVNDIIESALSFPFEETRMEVTPEVIDNLRNHFHKIMQHTLLKLTTRSLYALRNKLKKDSSPPPILQLSIDLTLPDVTIKPSLFDVQEIIDRITLSILGCTKSVKPWEIRKDINFHNEISKDKEIIKFVMLLTGATQILNDGLDEYVGSFNKYQYSPYMKCLEKEMIGSKTDIDRYMIKNLLLLFYFKELISILNINYL